MKFGLGHSSVPGAVMYSYYRFSSGLADDDITGARNLYGAGGNAADYASGRATDQSGDAARPADHFTGYDHRLNDLVIHPRHRYCQRQCGDERRQMEHLEWRYGGRFRNYGMVGRHSDFDRYHGGNDSRLRCRRKFRMEIHYNHPALRIFA